MMEGVSSVLFFNQPPVPSKSVSVFRNKYSLVQLLTLPKFPRKLFVLELCSIPHLHWDIKAKYSLLYGPVPPLGFSIPLGLGRMVMYIKCILIVIPLA